MNRKDFEVGCRFGFSVAILLDEIEETLDEIVKGGEFADTKIDRLKSKIIRARIYEEEFREILKLD